MYYTTIWQSMLDTTYRKEEADDVYSYKASKRTEMENEELGNGETIKSYGNMVWINDG